MGGRVVIWLRGYVAGGLDPNSPRRHFEPLRVAREVRAKPPRLVRRNWRRLRQMLVLLVLLVVLVLVLLPLLVLREVLKLLPFVKPLPWLLLVDAVVERRRVVVLRR